MQIKFKTAARSYFKKTKSSIIVESNLEEEEERVHHKKNKVDNMAGTLLLGLFCLFLFFSCQFYELGFESRLELYFPFFILYVL